MIYRPVVSGSSLQDLFVAIWRRRKQSLLIFGAIMAISFGVLCVSKNVYRSKAMFFLRLGRENVTADPTTSPGQSMAAFPITRDSEIASVLGILQTRSVIEEAVDKVSPAVILEKTAPAVARISGDANAQTPVWEPSVFEHVCSLLERVGLINALSDRERAIQKIMKTAEVNMVKRSALISIMYDARTPLEAQEIVSALAEASQDQHIRANRPRGSYQFLSEQSDQLKSRLKDQENQLRDAKTQTGLASPTDQRQILVRRIGKLEDESLQTSTLLTAHEAQLKEMKRALAELSPEQVTARTDGFPNVAADTMRGQLYELQVKEKELVTKFSDTHPEVRSIREQIKLAGAVIDEQQQSRVQETKGPNRVFESAMIALIAEEPVVFSLQAKSKSLDQQIVAAKGSLETLNDNEVLIARLQREADLAEANYRKYSENVEQARMDEALGIGRMSNLTLVQAATFDPIPVRPNSIIVLGIGAALGLLSAIGFVLVSENLGRAGQTAEFMPADIVPRMARRSVGSPMAEIT